MTILQNSDLGNRFSGLQRDGAKGIPETTIKIVSNVLNHPEPSIRLHFGPNPKVVEIELLGRQVRGQDEKAKNQRAEKDTSSHDFVSHVF